MKQGARGLTLIEVSIALLVGSLLVAVGMPAYQARVTREIVEEVLEVAIPAKETIEEYASRQGELPATQEVALPFVTSKFVVTTSWASSGTSGAVTIATRSGQNNELRSKAVVLTASYNPATRGVDWVCGGTAATTVAAEFLPDACKSP